MENHVKKFALDFSKFMLKIFQFFQNLEIPASNMTISTTTVNFFLVMRIIRIIEINSNCESTSGFDVFIISTLHTHFL